MFSYKIQSYQEDGSLDVVPFLEGTGLYLTSDPGLLHLFTREVTPAPLALPVAHLDFPLVFLNGCRCQHLSGLLVSNLECVSTSLLQVEPAGLALYAVGHEVEGMGLCELPVVRALESIPTHV